MDSMASLPRPVVLFGTDFSRQITDRRSRIIREHFLGLGVPLTVVIDCILGDIQFSVALGCILGNFSVAFTRINTHVQLETVMFLLRRVGRSAGF